jgi:hypothetical protein
LNLLHITVTVKAADEKTTITLDKDSVEIATADEAGIKAALTEKFPDVKAQGDNYNCNRWLTQYNSYNRS